MRTYLASILSLLFVFGAAGTTLADEVMVTVGDDDEIQEITTDTGDSDTHGDLNILDGESGNSVLEPAGEDLGLLPSDG